MKIVTQCSSEQMRRQQIVLAELGYYKGKIDGIWGPKTIEAKRKFESNTAFGSCVPNLGLPFEPRVSLPAGLYWERGLLNLAGLDLAKYDKQQTQQQQPAKTIEQEPEVKAEQPEQQKQQQQKK